MSFRDLGNRVPPPMNVSSPPRKNIVERDQPPHIEQPSPKSPMDQIAQALEDHRQVHNVRKEKSLISTSTTVPRYSSPSRKSAFSMLNDEIVQFQKLVNDLQRTIDIDVMTPEDQWRTRILLKSTEDVDYDLAYQIQVSPWNKQKDLAVQSSFSKLKRDFSRVHKAYRAALQQHHEKQKAEMALLSAQIEESTAPPATPTRRNKGSVLKKQREDYFDRVMRERQEETENINTKVHTVNQIYSELGKIVNDQQEKIDLVEDQIRYARANTEIGLERLENRRLRMCGYQPEKRQEAPPVVAEDEFHWTLPFKTFKQDIFEVQQDLVDLVFVSARKLEKLGNNKSFHCGPDTTSDEHVVIPQ